MKKNRIFVYVSCAIALVVGCVFAGRAVYYAEIPVKTEYVTSFPIVNRDVSIRWFSLRSASYQPFYGIECLENMADIGDFADSLNFDKYTYVVVIDYEAESLKVSFSEMKNRKLVIFPKQFVGLVTLGEYTPGTVNIYRIKKLDVDLDYHDRERGVLYANQLNQASAP